MKKITAILLTAVLSICFCMIPQTAVEAADSTEYQVGDYVGGSLLTDEDFSEGTALPMTRGIYLGSGSSSISKVGTGKIAASGSTVGQRSVSTISVTVRVERLIGSSWQVYTSWSATRYNAASVTSSKTLSVPQGYFYRVHSIHYANSDSSGSYTNGIWI